MSEPDMTGDYERSSRRRPRIELLPLPEQRQLLQKEEIIHQLLKDQELNGGRLPRHERQAAAQALKVSVRTVNYWLDRYSQYRQLYPEEPAVNALINLPPGRPEGQTLTKEQQEVALGAFLNRKRIVVYGNGQEAPLTTRADIKYVQGVLTMAFPDQPVSESTLRRFATQQRKEKPALWTLAQEGEQTIRREYLPKTVNDVAEANQRWQSDARYLPIYVRHQDEVCHVVLVSIIDDYSRYIVGWGLFPRRETDQEGQKWNVDFTAAHVRVLLANAMVTLQVRPYIFYTDKGSQFKAIKPHLSFLTNGDEPAIEMVNTRPGRPQGRGKIERSLGQVDEFLQRLPGFVADKRDRFQWNMARKSKSLLAFDDFEAQLGKYIDHINTASSEGKPSRHERWKQAQTISLPAPSLHRLALFGGAAEWAKVTVHDGGIRYKKQEYIPAADDEAVYMRWMNAVNREVPLCVLLWTKEPQVLVCLDGTTWEPMRPASERHRSTKKHMMLGNSALKHLKQELSTVLEDYQRLITEKCGGVPKIDAITGRVLVQEPKNTTEGESQGIQHLTEVPSESKVSSLQQGALSDSASQSTNDASQQNKGQLTDPQPQCAEDTNNRTNALASSASPPRRIGSRTPQKDAGAKQKQTTRQYATVEQSAVDRERLVRPARSDAVARSVPDMDALFAAVSEELRLREHHE